MNYIYYPSLVLIFSIMLIQVTDMYLKTKVNFANFTQIAIDNGYKSDEHEVLTEDGYLLTIFRLQKYGCEQSIPVLLMPGLFQTGEIYLVSGPNVSLGYLLANECYDVWAGNVRGNMYGRRHVNLNPDKDKEFWDFSADEIGYYDFPATVDYILEITGASKINLIGYSQSGGCFFIMGSDRPKYLDKINAFVGLSPPTKLLDMKSYFVGNMMGSAKVFEDVLAFFGIHEVLSRDSIVQRFVSYMCSLDVSFIKKYLCETIVAMIDVHHPGSISHVAFKDVYKHFPAGTSVKNLARYGQVMKVKKFQKYDYGKGNLKKYGSELPPVYDLRDISIPILIIAGLNDQLTLMEEFEWLNSELPNSEIYVIDDPNWNHLDNALSLYINVMMFPKINEFLKQNRVKTNG